MKSPNVDHPSAQRDLENVGAYDGGVMFFSWETLSSSDIKRKYAEYKTEEEGQKKPHCVVLSAHFQKT